MTSPMMKCGHAANAMLDEDGKKCPACAICAGINPGAYVVDADAPSLEGRFARCHGEKSQVPSSTELAFFRHSPDREFDTYYCGHGGWD